MPILKIVKRLCVKTNDVFSPQLAIRFRLYSSKVPLTDCLVKQNISWTSRKIVGFWLVGCAGMVYGAVAIGGLTRLTESGLSMVNWDLIKSMKPPFTKDEWESEFTKYKQFPEYNFKNSTEEITLNQFKNIWLMEYAHRMWGRATGLVFIIPCLIFWKKGLFSNPMKKRMILAGTLLISQGLIGWWMVKSGLDPSQNSNADVPRVSQYRLATHLSLAFVLYSIYLWTGMSHLFTPHEYSTITGVKRFRRMVHGTKGAIFLTIFIGAFVAGLDAGYAYNSWPKYGAHWVPENLFSNKPFWKNFFENGDTVQFLHRNMAYLTLLLISLCWGVGRRLPFKPRTVIALHSLLIAGYAQVAIGISTLIHHIPVWQASLHQNGALTLATMILWLTHEIRRLPK